MLHDISIELSVRTLLIIFNQFPLKAVHLSKSRQAYRNSSLYWTKQLKWKLSESAEKEKRIFARRVCVLTEQPVLDVELAAGVDGVDVGVRRPPRHIHSVVLNGRLQQLRHVWA